MMFIRCPISRSTIDVHAVNVLSSWHGSIAASSWHARRRHTCCARRTHAPRWSRPDGRMAAGLTDQRTPGISLARVSSANHRFIERWIRSVTATQADYRLLVVRLRAPWGQRAPARGPAFLAVSRLLMRATVNGCPALWSTVRVRVASCLLLHSNWLREPSD